MTNFTQYIKRGIRYILHGVPMQTNVVNVEVSVLPANKLLEGRTALVTGGTSGIGYAIAKAFVNTGAMVIITSRSAERAEQAAMSINQELNVVGRVFGIALDNTDVQSFEEKLVTILQLLPNRKLDILVNNAGIGGGNISTTSEAEYDAVMSTNLKSAFFLSRVVAKYMISNSVCGNILNIASSSSVRPATSAYILSKWGIRGLTEGLARSLIPHNIVVNGLAPGPTATSMLRGNASDENLYHPDSLIGRYVTVEEIANMAVILVSKMSRSIVGDIVYMTGGAGTLVNSDFNYTFTC